MVDALLADEGGCAWNRAQTAESLVAYLVEETYELVEAIEDGTPDDVREELGDVLYQVVLHSALAARASSGSFDLGDVVRDVSAKTVRRHPHVFGADQAADLDDIVRLYSAAKAREKAGRTSAYDGLPPGQPALARAQKLDAKRAATGAARPSPAVPSAPVSPSTDDDEGAVRSASTTELAWGRALLAQVDEAGDRGIDAERALRAAVREREAMLRRDERDERGEHGGSGERGAATAPSEGDTTDEVAAGRSDRDEQVPPQPE
ncbi:MazG nucleotide pyrophosphohydrolase domain-containing protein [Frigoribacterium sp. PvP054]|uniref:MazG nucleotide pyrophosphohydrolase domain-containing protein n=1 Tax=Frigoribacterium sp. PvP054 TaxID=3156438 RepID=UPI003391EB47